MKSTFTDTPNTHPATAELSTSEYHKLLSVDRRRLLLELLAEQVAPVGLTECATQLAAAEAEASDATPEAVDDVALALHHIHLPKLAEFGVIEYDPGRNQITTCPRSS